MSAHFFRRNNAIKIAWLKGMISHIRGVVEGSRHCVCSGVQRISIHAIGAGIEISLNNKMKPHLGENIVSGFKYTVSCIARFLLNRLTDRPHRKNVVLRRERANDLPD